MRCVIVFNYNGRSQNLQQRVGSLQCWKHVFSLHLNFYLEESKTQIKLMGIRGEMNEDEIWEVVGTINENES